ncbi:MAG TPA: hypothetical protein VG537_01300, partial [Candidatus Kapabacteria bacterium]|nr:hypothetical protein [Candidatus Kapabacteria bacterium]
LFVKLPAAIGVHNSMRFLFRIALLSCLSLALFLPSFGSAQTSKNPAKKKQKKPELLQPASTNDIPTQYYHLAGLGSAEEDTANTFPYPAAIFEIMDTVHTKIVVRFPGLGMLGVGEDTVRTPSFIANDSLRGYEPREPLYILSFPKTPYVIFVEVWSKDGKKLLDARPITYDMNVEKYKTAKLTYIHEPTTGMGSPTLRRRFQPTLLPFSIETNPGWQAAETLDSTMVYSLLFRDPAKQELAMSLTLRPAIVGRIDSAMWEHFKSQARIAFGSKGVAVNSIGDFQMDDPVTRRFIKAGYEFVSKNQDSTMDYVATFLTPRAILMLMAPLDANNQQLQYDYFRAIARSLKLD